MTRPSLPQKRSPHEHKLTGRVVLLRQPAGFLGKELPPPGSIVLEDYQPCADVLRSVSASAPRPRAHVGVSRDLAFGDVIDSLPWRASAECPRLLPGARRRDRRGRNSTDAARARDPPWLFGSRRTLSAGPGAAGPYPANIVVRPFDREAVTALRVLDARTGRRRRLGEVVDCSVTPTVERRRASYVLMLCSDWCVSGVNASLEAIGHELRRTWLGRRDPCSPATAQFVARDRRGRVPHARAPATAFSHPPGAGMTGDVGGADRRVRSRARPASSSWPTTSSPTASCRR